MIPAALGELRNGVHTDPRQVQYSSPTPLMRNRSTRLTHSDQRLADVAGELLAAPAGRRLQSASVEQCRILQVGQTGPIPSTMISLATVVPPSQVVYNLATARRPRLHAHGGCAAGPVDDTIIPRSGFGCQCKPESRKLPSY
jgi:hypothetical protein